MKRPPKAKPVPRWSTWPQKLAVNEKRSLYPAGSYTVWGRGRPTMLDLLLECGQALAKRKRVKLEKVVVFYPINRYQSILRRLNRLKKSHEGLGKYKGLTISGTHRLEALCVAFLIKDVEAHRTPADAYYTTFHPSAQRANPIPLYSEEESKIGKEIHR